MQGKNSTTGSRPRGSRALREAAPAPPGDSGLASERCNRTLAILIAATGALALLGWALLARPTPLAAGMPAMQPLTALCFVLSGGTMWLLAQPGRHGHRPTVLVRVGALIIVAVGVASLLEILPGAPHGLDRVLFPEKLAHLGLPHPGRLSPATAAGLLLFGGSWLSFDGRRRLTRIFCQFLALCGLLLGLVALLGYLYGAPALFRVGSGSPIGVVTAALFVVLALATLLAGVQHGWLGPIASDYDGGVMARRVLPGIVLVPIIVGWLWLFGERRHWYGTEFGVALFATATISVLASVVWWAARHLDRLDSRRRGSERALRAQAQQYRELFDHHPAPLWAYEVASGAIVMANTAAREQYGYPAGEFRGLRLLDLFPPEDRATLRAQLSRQDVFASVRREIRGRRKDGSVFPAEAYASTLRLDGRLCRLVLVLDITSRKRTESLLTAQRDLMRNVAEDAPLSDTLEAICRLAEDIAPGMRCSILLLDAAGQHVGHGAAPSLPASYMRAIEGAPIGPRAGSCGTAVHRRAPVIVEDIATDPLWDDYRALALPHGLRACWSTPIFDAEKRVLGTFAMYYGEARAPAPEHSELIEIATQSAAIAIQRDRSRQMLRASEARARTLFEQASDGIFLISRENRYLEANERGVAMLGYAREELMGQSVNDVLAPEDRARLAPELSELLSGRPHLAEWQHLRKDGTCFPAEVSARRLQDGNSLAVVRDLSASRRAEEIQRTNEALRRATEEAQAADRIKSAFLATMSHELRTPLNSIIGFTGLLLQELPGPLNPEQARQLGMVQQSARHLLALINDVLDISKIEAGELELASTPFDLHACLAKVIDIVRPLAETKGLSLRSEFPTAFGALRGDARRVEQILLNLLNNAVKFTDRGEVSLRAVKRDGAIAMEVEDTGVGIKPQDIPTLFQAFRQIDTGLARAHEGTGLGLAICQKLAGMMGGEIRVASEWQRGSTFSFILPIEEARS